MKIKTNISIELLDKDEQIVNSILHIHPFKENERDWSALSLEDTDPGHFDANRKPKLALLFDNCNLDAIIQALIIYKDNLKTIKNLP